MKIAIARRILGQAWPIILGQFAAIAFGVLDTVMAGRSSPADLAAMAIGTAVYASVFMGLMGVVNALNPIVAHDFGAGRHAAIGATSRRDCGSPCRWRRSGVRCWHSRTSGSTRSAPHRTFGGS